MPRKLTNEDLRQIVYNDDFDAMSEVKYSDLTREIDKSNSAGLTFVQFACAYGKWNFIGKILQKYIDPIKTDIDDKSKFGSVLFIAVMKNRIKTAKVLLEAGVTTRWTDKTNGDTLLHVAVKNRNSEMILLLLSYGVDIGRQGRQTLIELASARYEWECVEEIAKFQKTDAEDKAKYGSALLRAVCANREETSKLLLEAGAPKDVVSINSGDTALHKAVRKNNIAMIDMLLSFGCDLTIENAWQQTPMELAVELKYWDVVEAIAKKKKTNTNDKAKYGTALYQAVLANRLETVKLLLAAGAKENNPKQIERQSCSPIQSFINNFYGLFYHPKSESEEFVALLEKNLKNNRYKIR
jgi:ankyrin repeat protein